MPFGVVAASGQSKQNPTGTRRPYQPTPSTHPLLGTPRLQPHLWLLGTRGFSLGSLSSRTRGRGFSPWGIELPNPPHPQRCRRTHLPLTTGHLPLVFYPAAAPFIAASTSAGVHSFDGYHAATLPSLPISPVDIQCVSVPSPPGVTPTSKNSSIAISSFAGGTANSQWSNFAPTPAYAWP